MLCIGTSCAVVWTATVSTWDKLDIVGNLPTLPPKILNVWSWDNPERLKVVGGEVSSFISLPPPSNLVFTDNFVNDPVTLENASPP